MARKRGRKTAYTLDMSVCVKCKKKGGYLRHYSFYTGFKSEETKQSSTWTTSTNTSWRFDEDALVVPFCAECVRLVAKKARIDGLIMAVVLTLLAPIVWFGIQILSKKDWPIPLWDYVGVIALIISPCLVIVAIISLVLCFYSQDALVLRHAMHMYSTRQLPITIGQHHPAPGYPDFSPNKKKSRGPHCFTERRVRLLSWWYSSE